MVFHRSLGSISVARRRTSLDKSECPNPRQLIDFRANFGVGVLLPNLQAMPRRGYPGRWSLASITLPDGASVKGMTLIKVDNNMI
jgi:hypothetical protein